MKLAVVTDSSAYLPERIKNHPDLFVIPIPLIMDGKIYNEGIDIEADEYYGLLKNSKDFPTTSQPVVGEVLALYEELKEKGYDTILSIHLSSGISGFVNTLFAMKDNISGVTVIPYDSKITSMPMGHMVEAALDLNDEGQPLDEILAHVDRIRDNTYAYLIVDDLNNLVRGGRLTNGAALIGSLLKIKPILTFSEGKIVLFEKIRSSKKAASQTLRDTCKQFRSSDCGKREIAEKISKCRNRSWSFWTSHWYTFRRKSHRHRHFSAIIPFIQKTNQKYSTSSCSLFTR